MMSRPTSTYRLQFIPDFGFDDAAAVAPYLAELGISHVYTSPCLQAAPGSTHGYDVVDHSRVSDELGGPEAHARMCAAFAAAGLSQIVDIVPNHMAIPGKENRWWWDVLENGRSSIYASYFDIDWDPPDGTLHNVVLMPVLGDHYGRILESGDLTLERNGASVIVRYFDHEFPVDPRSLAPLVAAAATVLDDGRLAQIADGLEQLTRWQEMPSTSLIARKARKEELLGALASSLRDASVGAAFDAQLNSVGGDFDELDALLEAQNYRLSYWKIAETELDYRRFFDVNTLVALRAEDVAVFNDTHRLPLQWLHEGLVDGFRVDHVDGLSDPVGYLERLRRNAGPDAWIVVEKILKDEERMPALWPVAGTTGYEAIARTDGLFVEPLGEARLTDIYRDFVGEDQSWSGVSTDGKRFAVERLLRSDVTRLANVLGAICQRERLYRDYTRDALVEALDALLVAFPVYRTYASATQHQITRVDEAVIDTAIASAADSNPTVDSGLLSFIRSILLLQSEGDLESEFVTRFQQLTGPVMAKGVEDTAFYRYNRLISLNEVGNNPGRFGERPDDFHRANAETLRLWPSTMTASTTHDTKRSEDVRHRISLLSELPDEWAAALERWSKSNDQFCTDGDDSECSWPGRNIEYLVYQTLVGAYPIGADRLREYVVKASKEAKTFTTWTEPNETYDEALVRFIDGVASNREFQDDLADFVSRLVEPGRVTSLAAILLKLTSPGVPDTYQGNETWDLSLVDPDNRRPVDYEQRRHVLASLGGMSVADVLAASDTGARKMLVTQRALQLRKRRPQCFDERGSYSALNATGLRAANVVAFGRGDAVVTIVPRMVMGLNGEWGDTSVQLPGGVWRNVFTQHEYSGLVELASLFEEFPVALMEVEQ